jgi:hypothetical protein
MALLDIDLECNECGDELDGQVVRGVVVVHLCQRCFGLEFQAGHKDGYDEGYDEGYEEGYAEANFNNEM